MSAMGRDPQVRADGRASVGPRPLYARMTAAAAALVVTLVTLLGGLGILPSGQSAAAQPPAGSSPQAGGSAAGVPVTPNATSRSGAAMSLSSGLASGKPPAARTGDQEVVPAVPADSGSGRRIVFDVTGQRVWLVGHQHGKDTVRRTYLVSGSVTDNLKTGSYAVYSKSMHAVGVDDSGTMRYMVRFAHGPNAAIGFHDIPMLRGAPVQTRDQLGTAESHGCIRQWRPDAQALWRFAPVGTKVVVVA
jgi:lipoprotein-anchoring transpeptidase ErfK/SrfK